MALGITNVNEFYSQHYLDALLAGDIRECIAKWEKREEETGEARPDRKLSGCAQDYFKAKAEAAQALQPGDIFAATHSINVRLAEALGYTRQSGAVEQIEEDMAVPVLCSLERDGNPYLWIMEACFSMDELGDRDIDPLDQTLLPCQRPEGAEDLKMPEDVRWESLAGLIFRRDAPPRWLILLAGSRIFLIERHKWGQGKYLLFDIDDILGRRDADTLKAAAALLARDSLCPDDQPPLHDSLDDNSHKHAFAVSQDLKYGIRSAVEKLANEYVWYQRNVARGELFGDPDLPAKLTAECLTYMYRLLFLFFVEARAAELDVVPMKSEEYRLGYSLEALRDLEQMPLTTPAAQNGYYFDASLRKLFALLNEGHDPVQQAMGIDAADGDMTLGPGSADDREDQYLSYGFTVQGLRSPLFDLKRTPLLSSVKFRNIVLQEVIQLLSLSAEGARGQRGRRRERGRISYAQLGINQLGAVYEGLLSYSGFFAGETLYEVRPADAKEGDEKEQSYFIPERDLDKYTEEEFVWEDVEGGDPGDRRRKRYPKGSFVFRLAGRDRRKSASYYTPEVLTQCVVKYSLKVLLKDRTADDILRITICEPAMGSGAFLNEAINQLADEYLARKQRELGREIDPSLYQHERQKVKAYLAATNCYGVDLNPTAVDLAKVSLWLNTMYRGSTCPWFDLRLTSGNSLIGARRQVFRAEDPGRMGAQAGQSWKGQVPEAVPLGPEWAERPRLSIYHFLLPDEGMAAFTGDTVVNGLAPGQIARLKDWRKKFTRPFDRRQVQKLIEISDVVDQLWKQVAREQRDAVAKTLDTHFGLWGQDTVAGQDRTVEAQEKVAAELRQPFTAYRRLKLVMDYWCALWFWPISDAESLPTREDFLLDVELILKGKEAGTTLAGEQLALLDPDAELREEHRRFLERQGYTDVDALCREVERLAVAARVAGEVRFHHWELRFAWMFAERGGFDLIVGNPPWVKLGWDESGLLSDYEPLIGVRDLSAPQVAAIRDALLDDRERASAAYVAEYAEQKGTSAFLNAPANYPLLQGMQGNLYKCFITRGWEIGSERGALGLLHPEGIYDDPKGGRLRCGVYPRLRAHFQFANELKLFAEVDHHTTFSVNCYTARAGGTVAFVTAGNLFHPATIDGSFAHDGQGTVPGIKDAGDKWDLRPHRSRLTPVDEEGLAVFASVFDAAGTPPMEARLPVVHSREIVSVLAKFAAQPRKLADIGEHYYVSEMWHETNAVKKDHTIRRETRHPEHNGELILSGPHFFVGNPLYQTPNEGCSHNQDYSRIDLTAIPEDYLPRTNYVPDCGPQEYESRIPRWNGRKVTEFYRICMRSMLSLAGERTLIPALVPRGLGHIHTVQTLACATPGTLAAVCFSLSSLLPDFVVKISGKGFFGDSILRALPLLECASGISAAVPRMMRLNCLTAAYAELWREMSDCFDLSLEFAGEDARLADRLDPPRSWHRLCALRTDYERRQALVELDALAALALGLTEEELITIYRVQFPVLRKYEREDRYDQCGRLVPAAVLRIAEQWELDTREPLDASRFPGPRELVGEVETPGFGLTGGIRWEDPRTEPRMERIYPPPFTRCDREEDMRQAYHVFQQRLAGVEAAT